MKKVIIADDHPLMRDGIKNVLVSAGIFDMPDTVSNGADLLAKVRDNDYDLILLDMNMPGRNGMELIEIVLSYKPKARILVVSSHKEDIYAVRTIKAGAYGYLCKENASELLLDAAKKVANGSRYLSPVVAEKLADSISSDADAHQPHRVLSNREFEILMQVAQGKTVTDIANERNLSVKTVSTYKQRIKEKIGLESDLAIMRYAIAHGLITGDQ